LSTTLSGSVLIIDIIGLKKSAKFYPPLDGKFFNANPSFIKCLMSIFINVSANAEKPLAFSANSFFVPPIDFNKSEKFYLSN